MFTQEELEIIADSLELVASLKEGDYISTNPQFDEIVKKIRIKLHLGE